MAVFSVSARGVWNVTKSIADVAYKVAILYLAFKFVVGFYEFFDFVDGAAHAFYALAKGIGT